MTAVDTMVRQGPRLDLRGLDYYARRRELFAALTQLLPEERLLVVSAGPGDVYWLRYEMEAQLGEEYRWSQPVGSRDLAVQHVARLGARSARR